MCIFSGDVENVSKTQIFGRMTDYGTQFLVYEMEFSAADDVAMILPFPQKRGGDLPRFISFEAVPDFFKKLRQLFPEPPKRRRSRGLKSASLSLPVVEFGAFEGSFVPTIADFKDLDSRFRFSEGTLDAMTRLYDEYSFAVFKLKRGNNVRAHPMAFAFEAQDPTKIFFPTVHVHDGEWHEHEAFDHTLYAQVPQNNLQEEILEAKDPRNPTEVSKMKLSSLNWLRNSPAIETVAPAPVFRIKMSGTLPNKDQIFTLSA